MIYINGLDHCDHDHVFIHGFYYLSDHENDSLFFNDYGRLFLNDYDYDYDCDHDCGCEILLPNGNVRLLHVKSSFKLN